MFCPKCKIEYEDWVKECTDCKTPLVKECPPDDKQNYEQIEYKEVLSTFNQGDIAMIKSVLDSEGITYYFKGEYFNLMRPLVEPAILMVRSDQIVKCMDLLKDYKLQYRGIITDETDQ